MIKHIPSTITVLAEAGKVVIIRINGLVRIITTVDGLARVLQGVSRRRHSPDTPTCTRSVRQHALRKREARLLMYCATMARNVHITLLDILVDSN